MQPGTWTMGVALAGVISACAGDLEQPERFAGGVACEDPPAFVRESCGLEGCHVAGNLLGTVDLVSPGVAERLIDQPALMCDDEVLIDSADRSRSLFLDKLNTTPRCGSQMPFLRAPLNARERACVSAFVDQMLVGHTSPDASTGDASP